MKLTGHFANFLRDTVNLNQTRIDTLESSVESIKTFIKEANWAPRVWKFIEQGSWAHNTIIKPIEGGEFDADLLVIVDLVEGWEVSDYVRTLGEIFQASGVYKDKVMVWDYCVTITYAGQRKIDIAPCVRGRQTDDELEVCNKLANKFERSEPVLYTNWVNEKNGYSGSNSFRKVTRLIKYLRDIQKNLECPSILLTTLIGERINWNDAGADTFKDVPTTLTTIFDRLDDWLQIRPNKPKVPNPQLQQEDFAKNLDDAAYSALRDTVHSLRAKIKTAYEMPGLYDSIRAWREVFGDSFAKGYAVISEASLIKGMGLDEDENVILAGVASSDAAHNDSIVDLVRTVGRWLWKPNFDRPKHIIPPPWPRADIVSENVQVTASWNSSRHAPSSRSIKDFEELPRHGGIWFDLTINNGAPLPEGYFVRYRVTNTGAVAMALKKGRGGFENPQTGSKRWEELEYRGIHLVEAFIIRRSDGKLVGQSLPFHVVIQ
jgi:hypothetical protein